MRAGGGPPLTSTHVRPPCVCPPGTAPHTWQCPTPNSLCRALHRACVRVQEAGRPQLPIPYRAFLRSQPVQALLFTHFCNNCGSHLSSHFKLHTVESQCFLLVILGSGSLFPSLFPPFSKKKSKSRVCNYFRHLSLSTLPSRTFRRFPALHTIPHTEGVRSAGGGSSRSQFCSLRLF